MRSEEQLTNAEIDAAISGVRARASVGSSRAGVMPDGVVEVDRVHLELTGHALFTKRHTQVSAFTPGTPRSISR